MFEAFYSSYWQHPFLLWLVPVVFLLRLPRSPAEGPPRLFTRFVVIFTGLTLLDPLMTGPLADAAILSPDGNQRVSIFFVVLGDLRVFAIFWLFGREVSTPAKAWILAILCSLAVPVAQFALIRALPEVFSETRYTFLAYELLFLVVVALFRVVILPRRELPEERRVWFERILAYVGGYYGLWALADVTILMGWDVGYGLRVVPNLLYYSFFLPFAYWSAPALFRVQREAVK